MIGDWERGRIIEQIEESRRFRERTTREDRRTFVFVIAAMVVGTFITYWVGW